MSAIEHPGSLFIVVAPSGAGKTSMVRSLLAEQPNLKLSVSYTTRPPREGERPGIDYLFVDRTDFESRRLAGEFVEWAEVHGNLYATSRVWLADRMTAGDDILLEIDWQGATQVMRQFPDAIGIFIAPPSLEALRERLQRRGLDTPDVIERRVEAAGAELAEAGRFQYVIINQEFASALRQLAAVVEAARCRFSRQRARNPRLFDALGIPSRDMDM